MRKFILLVFGFFCPFIFILLFYFAWDPFKVLMKYDTFYDTNTKGWVETDRDYVSTTTFDNNYQKEHYNSFIFGNSRSIFYQVSDWKKHLDKNSNCFHFDASEESLFALDKKIKYLDYKNVKIKNVLLVLDYAILSQDTPLTDHLVVISPQLVNNSNFLTFHLTFLKAFISPKFLFAFADFKISGKIKPYMKTNELIDDRPFFYDIITNEIRFNKFEEDISKGEYYTQEKMESFYKRDTLQKYSPPSIRENQKLMLKDILNIFAKHNTNYKIIISPLYDQIKFNNQDLDYLVELFGSENVFDFSGINSFTSQYNNYYETSHYRPHIAREILNLIYQNE